jgi:hypothetical protein
LTDLSNTSAGIIGVTQHLARFGANVDPDALSRFTNVGAQRVTRFIIGFAVPPQRKTFGRAHTPE